MHTDRPLGVEGEKVKGATEEKPTSADKQHVYFSSYLVCGMLKLILRFYIENPYRIFASIPVYQEIHEQL